MINKPPFTLLILLTFVFSFSACEKKQTVNNANSETANVNTSTVVSVKNDLNVTDEFWKKQMEKALEPRDAPTGEKPDGLNVPVNLLSDGVVKQKKKMEEMVAEGFTQPLDFIDLADKQMKGELVEVPKATSNFVIDAGNAVDDKEFTSYSFTDGSVLLKPESAKFSTLKKLADDFGGTKYDLNNPQDRKQIKYRLLRTINPSAKLILEEISSSYQKKFNRPLKVSSLTRSIEYQILLNGGDANTFKVRDSSSLSPHSSGCAFDFSRKHLTVEEQNFIMQILSEMEQGGKVDALIEYNANASFHIFVYQDGKPPKV